MNYLESHLETHIPLSETLLPLDESNPPVLFKNSLQRLKTLYKEEKSIKPIIIGVGANHGCGKSQLLQMLVTELALHHGKEVILQQEMDEETMEKKLQNALLNEQLKPKPFLITAPEKFDEEIEYKFKSQGRKCRIKDKTNSLFKRRNKNKIAKKSRQKNRK